MKNTVESMITIEQLIKENSILKERNSSLENENAELSAKLNWFEEHYRLDQHRLYGQSSEKTVYPEQQSIFNEAEALSDVNMKIIEPTVEEIIYKRKKKQGKSIFFTFCSLSFIFLLK